MFARASAPSIYIRLFGAPSIATPLGPISSAKPFVFAAALYLGLNRGRAIRREELAALLWPDAADAKRSERMRWLVRQLKLAGLSFIAGTPELMLATSDVVLDTDALATTSSATAVLALVGTDVLAGYEPQIADGYARWLEDRRSAYRATVLRTLSEWLSTTRRNRSWRAAEMIAQRMLVLDAGCREALAALATLSREQEATQGESAGEHTAPTLIGREAILARLSEGLRPSAGGGHRLGLAGPSGIGKSRSVEALAQRAIERGISVAHLRCQRGDALRPLSLAVDLVRELMQMPGALGASPQSLEVLRRFTGETQSGDDGESPHTRRAAVYAAVRDLVGAVTDEAGLMVVVDDAQWAEPGSWLLLAPAFTRRSPSPLSWVVTIRADSEGEASGVFDTIFQCDDCISDLERELIWLRPLTMEDIGRLCVARAAPRALPAPVLDACVSRAAGIPFVAEALVTHWLELGDQVSLPPSVMRLVRVRLDRLSSTAAEVLRAVAVLGLDATAPAVAAVTQLGRRELVTAVTALETSGILHTVNGVLSAHTLWTEAVLAHTPSAALQLLHRYAAEWLEQRTEMEAAAEPRHHWAVATHWLEAGDYREARRALDHAASVLVANGFIVEAAAMLERGGDLAGESSSALHYYHRATALWMQEFGSRASEAIARLHARYDALGTVLHGARFNPHHDVELMAKTAIGRNRPFATENEVVERLLSCALSSNASPTHRLDATSNLLSRYKRCNLDRATATAMWQGVAAIIPTNELEAFEFERCAAEYHARVTDEQERAAAHLRRMVAIVMASDDWDAPVYAQFASKAADSVETHLGDVEASLALRRQALEQGRQRNSRHIVVKTLDGLLGTLLELGRPEEVRPLLAEFGRVSSAWALHGNIDRARAIYCAVCALEEGDAALARTELTIPLEAAHDLSGMARARIISIHAHLALLEQDDAALACLLPQLLACFYGRYVFMDHPALIAALALERFEGWDAAATFVRRFMADHRDEIWPARAELRRFLEPAPRVVASSLAHSVSAHRPRAGVGEIDGR